MQYEYCTKCEANLTLQKGYRNDLPYWVCKGCGEMLINPEIPDSIAWICDRCEAMLNIQPGFFEDCGLWSCTECGFVNKIDVSEIYLTDDEFRNDFNSPYKGLSDEDMLLLSEYTEERAVNNRDDVVIVRSMHDDKLYVRKILSRYDITIYKYLINNPVPNMPKIYNIFESNNYLIVIEEYIEGRTLSEVIGEGPVEVWEAIRIIKEVCHIVKQLHELDTPIIHRDVKPSNVIERSDGKIFLLDMNVAKWYKADEVEDTQLLGTQYYAAPEQLGYGFLASGEKSDIYAIGMLLNVLVTGKFPKEKRAPERIWNIVEKCICLEPEGRYTDEELIAALDDI